MLPSLPLHWSLLHGGLSPAAVTRQPGRQTLSSALGYFLYFSVARV